MNLSEHIENHTNAVELFFNSYTSKDSIFYYKSRYFLIKKSFHLEVTWHRESLRLRFTCSTNDLHVRPNFDTDYPVRFLGNASKDYAEHFLVPESAGRPLYNEYTQTFLFPTRKELDYFIWLIIQHDKSLLQEAVECHSKLEKK